MQMTTSTRQVTLKNEEITRDWIGNPKPPNRDKSRVRWPHGKFQQTFKEELAPILHKLFQKDNQGQGAKVRIRHLPPVNSTVSQFFTWCLHDFLFQPPSLQNT